MIRRRAWLAVIESLWEQKSVLWLSGVRRIGKTILAKELPDNEYFNCDLPSTRKQLEDPEFFLHNRTVPGRIVLDEIHRLDDPSSLLKIAADEFPLLRILATGSSTLDATRKFRDNLAGRKRMLLLTPVLWSECADFGIADIDRRLLHGGFPEMLLAAAPDPAFFQEWLDSFYARDIMELFGIRNRIGFMSLLRLLLHRSGGLLDVTDLSKESGLSRPTVLAHLEALETSHAIVRVAPWAGGGSREIVRRPRVYGFDTGIVAHVRGWRDIRDTDRGHLWEHLVLDELRFRFPDVAPRYWRDKSGREIDFVIDRGPGGVDTVEAKIPPDSFCPQNLKVFRSLYPAGRNYVVSPHVKTPYSLKRNGMEVTICRPHEIPGGRDPR